MHPTSLWGNLALMKYLFGYLIYMILLHGLFATSVVTMNQTRYNINDFYNEYGKKEWEQAKPQHREELVNDFNFPESAT